MFERYTERARRVLFFARYEASQLGRLSIETEHLLLGLIREGKGLSSHVFARSHLSLENVRKEIERRTVFQEKVPTSVEIPFSGETKRVLQFAAQEADRLLHNHIGTEHLLLGILREDRSVAAALLMEKGMRLDTVRDDIVQLLNEKGPDPKGHTPDNAPMPAPWARRPFDERVNTRLALSRLLKLSMYRIDMPDQVDIPLTISREPRTVDAYVMTRVADRTPFVHPDAGVSGGGVTYGSAELTVVAGVSQLPPGPPPTQMVHSIGSLSLSGTTMNDLALTLEQILEMPVIDETGLVGRYDIELPGPHNSVDALLAALEEHDGLALTREKRDVEMVVVRCG